MKLRVICHKWTRSFTYKDTATFAWNDWVCRLTEKDLKSLVARV